MVYYSLNYNKLFNTLNKRVKWEIVVNKGMENRLMSAMLNCQLWLCKKQII